MILRVGIENVTAEAMVQCLGMLGEALIDYQLNDVRDWINGIVHEVGQGHTTWRDHKYIADQLNATKLRASMRQAEDPNIPICAQYNQGRCSFQANHAGYKHVCVSCWLLAGAQHNHPLINCRCKGGSQQFGNGRQNSRDSSQQNGGGQNNGSHHSNHTRPHYNSGYRDRRSGDSGGSQQGDNHYQPKN